MGCGPKTLNLANGVYTKGSTSSPIFVVYSQTLLAGDYSDFRAKLELRDDSGSDCEVKRAVQTSDDGVTWDTAVAFDDAAGWLSTEGYSEPASFTSTDASKQYFRLGIVAKNKASTAIERMQVTMTIDLVAR